MKTPEIKPLPTISADATSTTQMELRIYEGVSTNQIGQIVTVTKEQVELFEAYQKVRGIGQDISERKRYARMTFWLITSWMIAVFLLLVLKGLNIPWLSGFLTFELSENIILALIGGTTFNILGIFYFVMRYLFNPKNT